MLSQTRIQPVVWSVVLLVGLIVLFLQLLMDAWLSDYDSRQPLEAANVRLRQYAIRIEDLATLQEHNHIAREIHDALGHSLTALNLNLQAANQTLAPKRYGSGQRFGPIDF
jgi:signal transduction histidine kinase